MVDNYLLKNAPFQWGHTGWQFDNEDVQFSLLYRQFTGKCMIDESSLCIVYVFCALLLKFCWMQVFN